MKQTFTKLFAALALLVSLAIPMGVWGQTYTQVTELDLTTKDYGNSAYNSNLDYTSNNHTWNIVYGANNNKGWAYFKMGGKSATLSSCNPCYIYNKTAITEQVDKVTVHLPSGSLSKQGMSVNSWGLYVYSDASLTTQVDYVAGGTITNSEGSFDFTPSTGVTWTANYYYKVSWDLANTTTTNGIVCVDKITLYKAGSTTTPSMSVSPNTIAFGDQAINPSTPYTQTFNVTFANLTENITITGFSGVTVSPASINYNATSPQTVTVSYNPTAAGSISGNISVNSSEVTEQLVAVSGSAYDPENVDTYERYTGALVEGDYIICANAEVAMKNVISGSRFENEAVTVTDNKITNPGASIIWHVAPEGDYFTMYNAAVGKYAAGTTSNNQGTLIDDVTDYAKWDITYQYSNYTVICVGRNTSTNKYLRRNGDYGWATYANSTGQVPTFYKKVITNQVAAPTFSVASGTYYETKTVELSCETSGATIYYTTDGTTPSASNGTEYTTAISVSNTMTIKAIAVKEGMTDSDVVTAEYTIVAPLATMDEIFDATSTPGDYPITFNNWIVTGVGSNLKRAFVTDGTKGFVIYNSDGGLNFQKGQVLSGTIVCHVQLLNGAPCVTGINASDFTITQTGAEPTVTPTTIDALSAVNTGAVVDLGQLTWNGSYFVDGNAHSIYYYNTIYSATFGANKVYNVKGVYVYYNGNSSPHEIAPRDANDIVEVTVPALYTYSINGVEGQTFDAHVGETITLAVGQNFNDDYTFAGWSTSATDMSNLLNDTYTLTDAATVFYAVYSHASNATVFSFTITPSDFNKTSYNANNGDHTSEATTTTGETMDVTWSSSNVMLSNDNEIQFRRDPKGSISAVNLGTITNVVIEETSTDALSIDYNDGSFTIENNGSATGYATSVTVTFTTNVTGYYTRIYTQVITGYGEDNDYGYTLIASPIDGVNPANVAGMTEGNFDLYRFNESAELEWENWKQEGDHNHFNLERGKGYLYAHKTDVTLAFAGTPVQGTTFNVTLNKTTDAQYEGVNLVGNPFGQTAYIDRDFYVMNQAGSEFITSSGAIAPMQGIIVGASSQGETLTFTTEAPSNNGGGSKVAINLSRNRGDVIDRAIVRFGEGSQLHKFQLRENSTKVYFTEGNQDFAVVRSQKAQGEMPVNFKAQENGTYTLNIDTENVEMNYLHLIDNMTGMDVDLLQTPSYTFDATTNDYASRFRLVFSTNNVDGPSTGSGTFAFFSNGNWVVDNEGEATLQVIDVNGRIVSNETINGTVATSIIATPGVYMLRLVNGNEVKTQKIVVR